MLGVDGSKGLLLAGCGRSRAPGVGGVEVGDAIRVGLGFAENGPCLVLEDRVVEAHLGKYGRYAVGALGVGDPPSAPAHDLQRRAGEVYAPANEISLAMHELQVVAPTTARPVHRAGALERAPQVTGPLRRGTSGAGEPQLFLGLYRSVARRAHRVTGTAEAVRVDRREPGLHPELRAPQAHHGAGDAPQRRTRAASPTSLANSEGSCLTPARLSLESRYVSLTLKPISRRTSVSTATGAASSAS